MIKSIHHNPTKFQIDVNKFYRFEKHLVELEGKLLDGTIYQVGQDSPLSNLNNSSVQNLLF